MGFWNVKAADLREGDEVRVTVMGGEEYLSVRRVVPMGEKRVRVRFTWGSHIPRGPFWDAMDADKSLTVRR